MMVESPIFMDGKGYGTGAADGGLRPIGRGLSVLDGR
jgi:hypothetical protein